MRPWTVTYMNPLSGEFGVVEFLAGPMDPQKAWAYAIEKLPETRLIASMVPGCHAAHTITASDCSDPTDSN